MYRLSRARLEPVYVPGVLDEPRVAVQHLRCEALLTMPAQMEVRKCIGGLHYARHPVWVPLSPLHLMMQACYHSTGDPRMNGAGCMGSEKKPGQQRTCTQRWHHAELWDSSGTDVSVSKVSL